MTTHWQLPAGNHSSDNAEVPVVDATVSHAVVTPPEDILPQQTLPSTQSSLQAATNVETVTPLMQLETSSIFAECEPADVPASAVQLLQIQAKEAEHREAQRRSKQQRVAALQQHLAKQHRVAGMPSNCMTSGMLALL